MPTEQSAWPRDFSPPQQSPVQQPPVQQPPEQEAWLSTQSFVQRPDFRQAGPQPPFPPPVPPPAEARRRRRPPLWALIAGGVVLVGLVAGLLVWAPWSPPPQAPTAVRVSSPTATTALVSWAAPKGGARPAQYDIIRDGKEQGIVPGTQTSWTDTGLAPGSRHSYAVVTEGNGQKSGPSRAVSVTTVTPPPAGVAEAAATYTTVTLRWSPPLNAPVPDTYEVYDTSTGKDLLETLNGSQTSYTVTGLVAGDDYSFSVGASWGSVDSVPATVQDAPTLSPPLSGSVQVNHKSTEIPAGSTGLAVGDTWSDNWTFTASCQATSCTLTAKGEVDSVQATVGSVPGQFTAKLTPSDGGYRGQATHVPFSYCNNAVAYNTVVVQIHPLSGGVSNGAWTSWRGTMTVDYPGQTVGAYYCSSGTYTMGLSS
jgi:hypothetical protein